MINANQLFQRPARSICQIFSQVLNLFMDNFKTFAVLALLQSLILLPVYGVFLIVLFLAFASEILVLSGYIGTRRLYKSSYDWDSGSSPGFGLMDSEPNAHFISPGFIFSLLGLFILFHATVICVRSVFQGAFVRATGEIFAGRSPHWQACLQIGWKKMCSIICFGFLFYASVIGVAIIWFGITVAPSVMNEKPSFGAIFWSFLAFFVASFVFSCGMTAGVTTVVIENKTVVAAMRRSWKLCKSRICFIFCCIFCFHILEFLGQMIVKQIMLAMFTVGQNLKTTAILMAAASWIMELLLGPLNAILNPMIYFFLRIEQEGLMMEEFQEELSLLEDSVELRTEGGIYHKIENSGGKANAMPLITPFTAL